MFIWPTPVLVITVSLLMVLAQNIDGPLVAVDTKDLEVGTQQEAVLSRCTCRGDVDCQCCAIVAKIDSFTNASVCFLIHLDINGRTYRHSVAVNGLELVNGGGRFDHLEPLCFAVLLLPMHVCVGLQVCTNAASTIAYVCVKSLLRIGLDDLFELRLFCLRIPRMADATVQQQHIIAPRQEDVCGAQPTTMAKEISKLSKVFHDLFLSPLQLNEE